MPDLNGRLTMVFSSDWHCGTGQGRHGGYDRLIARDPEELPYVPAKTLLGLWRDACEKAARGLDNAPAGAWHDVVTTVFGAAPGRADDPALASGLLTVRPARLPTDWRSSLCASGTEAAMLRRQLTLPRFGVRIDETDGVAVDDTLRMVERARAGLMLEAAFQLPDTSNQWAAELLLHAGAKLWHHTGSSRRRGAGRCTVKLDGLTPLEELLEDHGAEVAGLARGDVRAMRVRRTPLIAVPATPSAWPRTAVVTIETRLPVICTRTVRGNVATSHDFIPGGTILPVLAGALGKRAAGLIRNGHVIVADATPVIGGHRAAAAPTCLVSGEKGREWLTSGTLQNGLLGNSMGSRSVSGWASLDAAGWTLATVELEERGFAHITDETGRPDENGFYTFETIPAGTVLQAIVRASDVLTDDEWRDMLALDDTEQTFGRYRRGDFGLARVRVTDSGRPTTAADSSVRAEAVVWLRSDTYLLDEAGIPSPSSGAVAAEVAARLGVTVTTDENNLVRVVRRDSWTTSHTLPRDSRVCLAAGSVIPLRFDPPVEQHRLDQLTVSGVGALRSEGFGECEFLPAELPLAALTGTLTPPAEPAESGGDLAGPSGVGADDWARFHQLAWQRTLTDLVRSAAANPDLRTALVGLRTTKAARGTLREAARLLRRDDQAVRRWLEATNATSKKDNWGTDALELIDRIGGQRNDKDAWRRELATILQEHSGTNLSVVPDLAGLLPRTVAAALIGSCLAQQARADKQADAEEEVA